jgi:FkbM family methyltransferase
VPNSVVALLKRQIVRRYPDWVAAFHDARMRREIRRYPIVDTPLGFRFAGPVPMQDGSFEPEEVAFLRKRIPHAHAFVDIGANAGYFSCIARQHGTRVIAVEPAAQNLDLLYRNIAANRWSDIEVFPVGLAEQPGLGTLYGDGTGASLVTRWAGVSEAWQRTIPLTTLDALVAGRFRNQQLLIKIDVEGTEHAVLAGASETLGRRPAPVWLVEVCFSENFPNGVNPHFRETFERFWAADYSAWSVDAARSVLPADVDRWIHDGRRDFGYVSYVFESRHDPDVSDQNPQWRSA